MMQIPEQCPLCRGPLVIRTLQCRSCGTEFHGHFTLSRPRSAFDRLTFEQLQFLEVFVRCEGKFSRMEKELGLSYPTLRNRLRSIIRAMGFAPEEEDEAEKPGLSPEERRQILEDLEAGRITPEEALARLQGQAEASA